MYASLDVAKLFATELIGPSKVVEKELMGTSKVLARCRGPSKVLEDGKVQAKCKQGASKYKF